jgi:hypothetical protein
VIVPRVHLRADGPATAKQGEQAVEQVSAANVEIRPEFADFPGNPEKRGDIRVVKTGTHESIYVRRCP